jgi:hypothetical protein
LATSSIRQERRPAPSSNQAVYRCVVNELASYPENSRRLVSWPVRQQ